MKHRLPDEGREKLSRAWEDPEGWGSGPGAYTGYLKPHAAILARWFDGLAPHKEVVLPLAGWDWAMGLKLMEKAKGTVNHAPIGAIPAGHTMLTGIGSANGTVVVTATIRRKPFNDLYRVVDGEIEQADVYERGNW